MSTAAVALVRRWAVDWLNGRHPEACDEVLATDYGLLIGGHLLGPREAYVPATLAQLSRWPGLVVTVHDLAAADGRVALVFTESGASARLGGRTAAWSGVALFRAGDGRLTHCWAEEDYWGRRRQLAAGVCDRVDRPAAAPWDTAPGVADPSSEAAVLAWLAGSAGADGVVRDDEGAGQPPAPLLAVQGCQVHELWSAGDRVAFAAVQTGTWLGGPDGPDGHVGRPASVSLAGLVQVRDGRVTGGRVVRDRLGATRALAGGAGGG